MAIKYYAGNRLTGVSGDTKPTTLPTGSTFLETNTDDLYLWDGDSWNIVASNTGTETLANKTFSDSLVFDEISVPGNAAADKVRLYAKAGGKLYSKDDSGNEFDLTAGAGSASNMDGLTDTDLSSPSSAHILVYDGSNSWDNKAVSGDITIATTGATTLGSAAITGQTAETTPQGASDFVLMYDNSASALRKVTVSNLLQGGVSADTLNALNDTTLSGVGSAHVLIYDGTDSWDNKAVSGDITINASGVTAIGTDKVTGTMIHANAVDDSSLEQNGTQFRVKASGVTNAMLAGSIAMSKTALVAGTGITLSTNTLNVDAAQTQITSVGALNAGSITSGFGAIDTGSSNITTTGTVTVGNLVVNGTSTKVDVSVLTVVDPIIHLQTAAGGGNLSSDTNKDVGIAMEYHNGSAAKEAFLGWDDSAGKLTFIPDASISSEVVSGSVGTIVANLEGDVTGDVTGSSGSTTGNAATATALANARTIGGTSFDGTANIAVGLAATATALATARTIGGTSFDGTANIAVGLAATATALATARTLGGVSFDGTANINLPGVNAAGNQNTSGTAAALSATLAVASGGTNTTSYTKGDILIASAGTTLTKLAVGTDDHVLTADASTATGIKWAAASGGSGASESFAIAMAVAL